MADYIDGEYIEDFPDKESLEDSDFFIVEDSEATKKTTFKAVKEAVTDKVAVYFAITSDANNPPAHDLAESSVLGDAVLGQMILNVSDWMEDFPTGLSSGDYVWTAVCITHPDGTIEWTSAFCLMDQNAKESILALQSALATKAEQTEVDENATAISGLETAIKNAKEEIKELQEQITELKKSIGDTGISDLGDGSITGAINSVRYAILGPDEDN